MKESKRTKQTKAISSLAELAIELGRIALILILIFRVFPGRNGIGVGTDDVDMEIVACGKGRNKIYTQQSLQ